VSLNLLITSILARHAGGEDALRDAVAAATSVLAGRSGSPPQPTSQPRSPVAGGRSPRSKVGGRPPVPQPAAKAWDRRAPQVASRRRWPQRPSTG